MNLKDKIRTRIAKGKKPDYVYDIDRFTNKETIAFPDMNLTLEYLNANITVLETHRLLGVTIYIDQDRVVKTNSPDIASVVLTPQEAYKLAKWLVIQAAKAEELQKKAA